MIILYSGVPGSGKSLHMAKDIYLKCFKGQNCIGTFPINEKALGWRKGKYFYVDLFELKPKYLYDYAEKYHKHGKEGQTLIFIDEAQRILGCREWNDKSRKEWNDFFQVHRHYGFNIIIATQSDKLLDKQVRYQIESEYKHRAVKNFHFIGFLISIFMGGAFFCAVEYWYQNKEKLSIQFFSGSRKLYKLYDSYIKFEKLDTNDKQLIPAASLLSDNLNLDLDEDFEFQFIGIS